MQKSILKTYNSENLKKKKVIINEAYNELHLIPKIYNFEE